MSDPLVLSPESAALQTLVATLLDFERAPGRYALALREPRPLFDATHAVMLLAAGRPVAGLPPLIPGQHTGAVQLAARFFVRTVLLRPGVDHYSLLGLMPDCGPEALRDHYRLMIRLTHPDFAATDDAWPADAAARINIAHGVLSSAVKRAAYDASLNTTPSAPPLHHPLATAAGPETPLAEPRRPAAAMLAKEASDRSAKRLRKIALAAGGAMACAVLLWLMTPGSTDGSLVAQRAQSADTQMTQATQTLADSDASALANAEPDNATPDAAAELPTVAAPLPAVATIKAVIAKAKRAAAQTTRNDPEEKSQAVADQIAPVARPEQPTRPAQVKAGKAVAKPTPHSKATTTTTTTTATAIDIENDDRRLSFGLDTHLTVSPTSAATEASPSPSSPPAKATGPAETQLTMAQVQPQIAQVLSGLQSGKGENVVQWLEGNWRDHPAANTFLNNYQRSLAGQSVVQLGKVQLRSRSVAEQFVVDGVVELYLQDSNAALQIKELQVSAYFLATDGQPMLTKVVLKRP